MASSAFKLPPAAADGWLDDTNETWTYASGSGGGTATFTVPGDQTAKYTTGTRIKLTQSTVKYFVVVTSSVSSGTTTVTITAGADYTLTNATITANYHSYQANPQGYPGWFTFTPTIVGWASTTENTGRFAVDGRVCHIYVAIDGTSNATNATFTVPLPSQNSDGATVGTGAFQVMDNGATKVTPGMFALPAAGSSTITMVFDWQNSNTFTASGRKRCIGQFFYQV